MKVPSSWIERRERHAFLPALAHVGGVGADRDHALAALDHVGDLLIALHQHDVVRAQLLEILPAVLLRERAHDGDEQR